MDTAKRQKVRKANKIDELAREDNLSMEAKVMLQTLAKEFLQSCFNRTYCCPAICSSLTSHHKAFLATLLKDIKSERPKIAEKDHLRLLYVTKWFLEFFLCLCSHEAPKGGEGKWTFGLIAEVTERGWIIWVLKRMREAVEEKVHPRPNPLSAILIHESLAQALDRSPSGY
jgi:replication fork protection complex subunit Tof1/Swi1